MMIVTVTPDSTQEAIPVGWCFSPDEALEWDAWSERMLAMIEQQKIEVPLRSDCIDILDFVKVINEPL